MRDLPSQSSVTIVIGIARAIPAIVMAGGFGWMAVFIRGNGGGPADWGAPAFLAVLSGVGALSIVLRAVLRRGGPQRVATTKAREPEAEPEFDADAALRRYMDRKGDAPAVEAVQAGAPTLTPQRPVFGRKAAP